METPGWSDTGSHIVGILGKEQRASTYQEREMTLGETRMGNVPYVAKTLRAGGFLTRYLEAGNPADPTVVLVHDGGFGTTAELCWEPVIKRLHADYHLIVPELLGFGGTDKVVFLDRSPYAARIPHVAAFLTELAITGAPFVGTSFGGSLLLRALVEPGDPWHIGRALSISGTGGPYRLSSGIQALADYEPSLEAAERLTALLVKDMDGMGEHVRQRYENSLIPGHWETMTAPRLQNPATQRESRPDSFLEQLAEVTTPLQLIEGDHDSLLESGWAERLAELSPAATAVKMDSAHEPNIDAPDDLCKEIAKFLSTSEGASNA